MEDKSQDVILRAYSTLQALRKNIEKINYGVTEVYVQEFHGILNRLRDIGIEVSEFRIPDSLVKPRITATFSDGRRSYSDEKYVDKPFILTKLDAILGYFEFVTSETPKRIGFRKANE